MPLRSRSWVWGKVSAPTSSALGAIRERSPVSSMPRLDAGITLIDTAEEYSITSFLGEGHSEELIGVALRSRRDEAVIATKFLNTDEQDPAGAGRQANCHSGRDQLAPARDRPDRPVPAAPTRSGNSSRGDPRRARALVRDGKVREVGCCNFTAEMLDEATGAAARAGSRAYRSCQLQYSALERPPADLLASVERNQMSILAYFPLASGLLTGKYRRGHPPPADARLGADGVVSGMLRQGIMARRPPCRRTAHDHRTAHGPCGGTGPFAPRTRPLCGWPPNRSSAPASPG